MPGAAPFRALAPALCATVLAGCSASDGAVRVDAQQVAPRVGEARPSASPSASPAPVVVVQRGDGDLDVVPGSSAVVGSGDLVPYVVEVEGGLGVDPVEFAEAVEAVLADPRSWSAGGRRAVQRVDGGDVGFRVALASPETTDRLCSPLDTGGYFSCANGDRAVVNVARWLTGAPTYAGRLADYRSYLLNHEVGHTLGLGHADCPGPGEVAPVMVQQSKSLEGCRTGPWPYPDPEGPTAAEE